MPINPGNVVRLLFEKFGNNAETPIKFAERELCQQLSDIILTSVSAPLVHEENVELDFEDEIFEELSEFALDEFAEECFEEEMLLAQSSEKNVAQASSEDGTFPLQSSEEQLFANVGSLQSSSGSSFHPTPEHLPNRSYRVDIPFFKRKRAVEFWRERGEKHRKISAVQNKFRYVESERQLYDWEKQVSVDGPLHEKFRRIGETCRTKFMEARASRKAVHDVDLKRWALISSRELQLENFQASRSWLLQFKKTNRITSRKITRFVSRGHVENDAKIVQSAQNFVVSIRNEISTFGPENIYNTDQSGFNLELHGGRTLAISSERRVEAQAQSVSALTHSYTIMPTISASGNLLSPLLIVFKEPNGKFGVKVETTLYKPSNVYLIAAKSSIMGKSQITQWFTEVFLPNCKVPSILLADSLKAYSAVTEKSETSKLVNLRTIPPHTTGIVQPLDVFFFRVWKTFCRKICDFMVLENLDVQLRQRNNIIKMQSLLHNQLSAPKFLSFRRVAWFKAGYFDGEPPEFIHPITYCFPSDQLFCSNCTKISLFRCAWCEKPLCVQHGFIDIHLHNE